MDKLLCDDWRLVFNVFKIFCIHNIERRNWYVFFREQNKEKFEDIIDFLEENGVNVEIK